VSIEYRIIPMVTDWKLPFNLAFILHILVVASALVLPKYLDKKPILPDFQTVDLVNIAEPQAEPTPPKTAAAKPAHTKPAVKARQTKVIKPEKAVSNAPPVVQEAPEAQVKAISIKPLKRKLKKKLPPDTRVQDQKKAIAAKLKRQQQAIEIKRQLLLQEAHRQKALAEAEAAAANDAVNALKQMLQADAAASSEKSSQSQRSTSTPKRTSSSNSILETQYQASIFSKLQQYWALPEIKQWNPDLTAIVVIQIARNGQILSHRFEKRSGDRVYDQFVSRTIQEANPLSAIPGALKMQQYTIGLRFKPGRIQ